MAREQPDRRLARRLPPPRRRREARGRLVMVDALRLGRSEQLEAGPLSPVAEVDVVPRRPAAGRVLESVEGEELLPADGEQAR